MSATQSSNDNGGGSPTRAAPPKIVVVDDDPVHNRLLGAILEQAGYEVQTYESGAAAVAEVGRGCDCLITDYHMPGMNGVELIRAVRRKHSPVCIVLTGSDGGAIDEQAKASAVAAVLRKPTHPRLILNFLKAILCGEWRNSAAAPKVAGPANHPRGKGGKAPSPHSFREFEKADYHCAKQRYDHKHDPGGCRECAE